MTNVNLRDELSRAVRMEWLAFQQRHPRLAAVLDEGLLVEQVMASIQEDDEYRQAMEQAAAAGMAGEAIMGIIQRYVRDWLRRLI